jgi:hypothetical protein
VNNASTYSTSLTHAQTVLAFIKEPHRDAYVVTDGHLDELLTLVEHG